jgi:hypothetical protein
MEEGGGVGSSGAFKPAGPQAADGPALGEIAMYSDRARSDQDDDFADSGLSMVVTVLSMGITAILVALLLSKTFTSGSSSDTSINNAPGVALATAVQAQQTLSTALTTVATVASTNGYDAVTASALSASNPSITFVSGPSSSPTTVSVSTAGGVGSVDGISGIGAGGDGTSGGGGSVTLADRSTSGTCWLVWKSAGSPTWYGAQTGASSCTAPALASAPLAGPVTSAAVGWQPGSFPAS